MLRQHHQGLREAVGMTQRKYYFYSNITIALLSSIKQSGGYKENNHLYYIEEEGKRVKSTFLPRNFSRICALSWEQYYDWFCLKFVFFIVLSLPPTHTNQISGQPHSLENRRKEIWYVPLSLYTTADTVIVNLQEILLSPRVKPRLTNFHFHWPDWGICLKYSGYWLG